MSNLQVKVEKVEKKSNILRQLKVRVPAAVVSSRLERGLREVMGRVQQVAPTDAPVLILGESGTGKELLARLIHRESGLGADAPFIPVNLAAIPRELTESTLLEPDPAIVERLHRTLLDEQATGINLNALLVLAAVMGFGGSLIG